MFGPARGPAFFTGAIPINDAAFCQIVWRKLDVYSVAGKNSYTMPAQASGDMRKDDVAVIELDGKGRARKNLFDATQHFKRGFFDILSRLGLRRTRRPAGSIARRNVERSVS
jgi:hypothetical protein